MKATLGLLSIAGLISRGGPCSRFEDDARTLPGMMSLSNQQLQRPWEQASAEWLSAHWSSPEQRHLQACLQWKQAALSSLQIRSQESEQLPTSITVEGLQTQIPLPATVTPRWHSVSVQSSRVSQSFEQRPTCRQLAHAASLPHWPPWAHISPMARGVAQTASMHWLTQSESVAHLAPSSLGPPQPAQRTRSTAPKMFLNAVRIVKSPSTEELGTRSGAWS